MSQTSPQIHTHDRHTSSRSHSDPDNYTSHRSSHSHRTHSPPNMRTRSPPRIYTSSSSRTHRTRAAPRPHLLTRIYARIRRLLHDLYLHMRENPLQVVLPLASLLMTGGVLAALAKRVGIVLPAWLIKMAKGLGGAGGIGGLGALAGIMGGKDRRGGGLDLGGMSLGGGKGILDGGSGGSGGGMWNGAMRVLEEFL